MGMAASQARLLCITARIHDVEYQAQSIQNAKIQLATQSDRAYEDYLQALEDTTLTISTLNTATGANSIITANFNNLCSKGRVMSSTGDYYAIRDNQGRLVVEEDVLEAYEDFGGSGSEAAYQFALFMVSGDSLQAVGNANEDLSDRIISAEEAVYARLDDTEKGDRLKKLREKLENLTGSSDIYANYNDLNDEDRKTYDETLANYKAELYKKQGANIYQELEPTAYSAEDFDSSLFNYYVSIFQQIEYCGGCVSIEDYNGLNGDAANDSDWLQAMIQSGQFTIEVIGKDSETGKVVLESTSPSSDSCLSYTETTTIDKKALAKAEAEYEHALKDIDKKDQKYDLDLSKLETERTALTTEYDSVKKVIEDNIDRTFGIFS